MPPALLLILATAPTDLTDTLVRYAFSALLGWAAASAHVGKKLQSHEKAMIAKMDAIQKANEARMIEMEREHARMAAELWGAQGDGGLRRAVDKVQTDLESLHKTTTEVLIAVRSLSKTTKHGEPQ